MPQALAPRIPRQSTFSHLGDGVSPKNPAAWLINKKCDDGPAGSEEPQDRPILINALLHAARCTLHAARSSPQPAPSPDHHHPSSIIHHISTTSAWLSRYDPELLLLRTWWVVWLFLIISVLISNPAASCKTPLAMQQGNQKVSASLRDAMQRIIDQFICDLQYSIFLAAVSTSDSLQLYPGAWRRKKKRNKGNERASDPPICLYLPSSTKPRTSNLAVSFRTAATAHSPLFLGPGASRGSRPNF
ncbi:hypothetical protein MBM_02038 [Drepanopeziza brunnea f. sp. 'multigermtubi' MB_m1]|uniref:Uncharacterized protein n=1 Tax=Marssonina brunnea f. sp. multigermtubi (strain MB_m1) TaxID=1072389 RepID=K1X4I9_MARBU|nr:uncharacterized protein MBM_02038 [Drepanopeziza brunnea f. sp. 'multigermtubi' MB_m1]EKD20086.1 hypothetical protein MBM_02038 [Drepanopeziza brunnea f. sp. 'multigermtubi' MB_m1]